MSGRERGVWLGFISFALTVSLIAGVWIGDWLYVGGVVVAGAGIATALAYGHGMLGHLWMIRKFGVRRWAGYERARLSGVTIPHTTVYGRDGSVLYEGPTVACPEFDRDDKPIRRRSAD